MRKARWLPWQADGDPSRRWMAVAWIVLLAYRALRLLVGSERAIAAIRDVLSRQFRRHKATYMEERFGIDPSRPGDAFDRIARNYQRRGIELFGPRFTYIQVVQTPGESHTHITKCFFNDFFRQHRAPEAVKIFCALDAVWIDELHDPRYATRFERPTTLASGGDACRFQFSRLSSGQQQVSVRE